MRNPARPWFFFELKPLQLGRSPRRVAAVAILCVLAASLVLAQKPLLYNNYYICNGTRIVVVLCTLGTVENDYNDCIVQFPDRPPLANGLKPSTSILRKNLVQRIQTCKDAGPAQARGAPPPPPPPTTPTTDSWLVRYFGPVIRFAGMAYGLVSEFGTIAVWVFWIAVILIGAKVIRMVMGTDKDKGEESVGWKVNSKAWKKSNDEALAVFGPNQQVRTQRIDEVFDRRQETIKADVIDSDQGMHVEMGRSLAAMPLREVEALRTSYHLYNMGMQEFMNFYIARVGIIYGDGKGMLYGSSNYGNVDFERYMGGYKLEASVSASLQDLTSAISRDPENPVLIKLKAKLFGGGGGDLVPTAPLKSALKGQRIGNGLILGLDDKTPNKFWYFDGEGSLITVAPTRMGKTASQVYPNMLQFKGPAIVLDVKGEIYAKTSEWRKQNVGPIYRFSPTDPVRSNCYNPLTGVRSDPMFLWSDARNLADLMITPSDRSGGGNSKFFEEAARDVIHTAIAYVCLEPDVMKRPMSKVLDIIHGLGWNQFVGYLQARVDMPSMARAGASLAQTLTPETRGSVLQTAQRSLSAWTGDLPERATSRSDWQPSEFRSGKNPTLYICINFNEMAAYRSILRTIIGQHIGVLTSGEPPHRTDPPAPPILFILDELPQLKNMPPVAEALVVGAGYGVKLWMFVQSVGQLKDEYSNAEGMIDNCAVRMYMNPGLIDGTAQKLSDDIGFRESVLDGNRVKIVEPNVLAGPEFKDVVLVWARNMARPAALRKNFSFEDPALAAKMG